MLCYEFLMGWLDTLSLQSSGFSLRENDASRWNLFQSFIFDWRHFSNDWQFDVILTWQIIVSDLLFLWLTIHTSYLGLFVKIVWYRPLFGHLKLSELFNLVKLRLDFFKKLVSFNLELIRLEFDRLSWVLFSVRAQGFTNHYGLEMLILLIHLLCDLKSSWPNWFLEDRIRALLWHRNLRVWLWMIAGRNEILNVRFCLFFGLLWVLNLYFWVLNAFSGVLCIIFKFHILVVFRLFLFRHVKFSEKFIDVECFKGVHYRVLFKFSLLFLTDMVYTEDFIK